jgi:transcriptional regulator with XRE-family HTH domain
MADMTTSHLALLVEGRAAATSGRGRRLRESAALTQSEIAKLAGVTPAAVCRWEAGERTPSATAAVAYAKALRRIAHEVSLHA